MKSKEVGLAEAEPGMELARDLLDRHGTVLLQQGSILSASLLAALERRGIARLRVVAAEPDEGTGQGADREAERARREARLAHLFRHQQGAPADRLRARLLAYRLEGV